MIFKIIFYILLVDAIGANILTWFGSNWYIHHFRTLSRVFPPAKGWVVYYLILVVFIGLLVM